MIGRVIVPGIGGSDGTHWQTLWQQQWGADAVRIDPGSWSQPDLDDWVAAVDRAARLISPRVEGIALVGHSLDCWAVAEWLLLSPVDVPGAAFLVAPPDPTGDVFPSEDAPTFVALQARRLPVQSTVVGSTDDPYCGLRGAEQLAAAWGSDLLQVDRAGHLNSASGLGTWPTGREALERLECLVLRV
ncbi:alpha/beta hydrolase [Curtobacterium sp. A7_M15]|uniref:RBBP9/YdeN family alpha/beta hydrolase n=1 Tax=Curtobacterium sp. A7_M15 TaxID=3065241 RepID=UPI0027379669|nr:alpha/beta hydrolase [Curtobacterium sp. A7_M15]MDP4332456.1 alpha/beta hydrolase [Curtobacterium sp. A7_M15]